MRDFEYASLTQVQSWSDIPRGAEMFQYLLTFENAPVDPSLLESKGEWWFGDCWHRTHTNYPATFVVIPGKRWHLQLTYACTKFDRPTAERMLEHYSLLLERMIWTAEARLCDITMFGEKERGLILDEWNRTERAYADPQDLVACFEAHVLSSPNNTAARCGEAEISYGALNEKANRLAHALTREGVRSDQIVALLDARGIDFLAAMLGIFKAGAGYLPLDPAYPEARIVQVLEESQVDLLLVGDRYQEQGAAIAALSATKPSISNIAMLWTREQRCENPARPRRPQNIAFVISTSGSTGKPKGAMVEHQGMFNNAITKVPTLNLTSADVIAQTASQCFDISVWQFLTALAIGARIEIFPDEISQDPQRLLNGIAACGVSVLEAVPSMIKALLEVQGAKQALAGLRWLLPCGEAFTPELCRRFMERHPNVRLLNAYGPAECSDDVSYYPIVSLPEGDDLSVPIGRPVDNTRLYILNRWLEPAPIGAPGEICVAGLQVGRGYLNRPDLTAAVFLPDPFGAPGTRLYRTGDLGCFRGDGVIEFLGRIDHQVKIRGFRVEPGEIEACLVTHPSVEQACVIARQASKGVYRLVAYVAGSEQLAPGELRSHIRRYLPEHMVPSAFVALDALPLTANGKVDRKRLPLGDTLQQFDRQYVAPRSETEEILSEIWSEVLATPRVGVEDNFFELGGHSLLAIQTRSRIQGVFEVDLPLRAIFECPTIAELAQRIEETLIAALEAMDEEEAMRLQKQLTGKSHASTEAADLQRNGGWN